MFRGCIQYEVDWEDFDDPIWNDADHLDCLELIEEYEQNCS